MWRVESPASILSRSLETLLQQLGSIRSGGEDAVHDARTTVRRTREAVALVGECSSHDLDELEQMLRRLARVLGEARDADVRRNLAEYTAARLRVRSNLLGVLQSAIRDDQLKSRRRAIKAIEQLDLSSIRGLALGRTRVKRRCTRAALQRQLALRAASLAASIFRIDCMRCGSARSASAIRRGSPTA
jgi:CHAD domain-containing protein